MSDKISSSKVAVVQASSLIMDKQGTIEKIQKFTQEAAKNHAKLVLFPEAFIPGYPRGLTFGTTVGHRSNAGKKDFQRYYENAVAVPGQDVKTLGSIAKENNVYLIIGVIEKQANKCAGTLYCSILYFNPNGNLVAKHRKLKPTGQERIIWGEGDGSTLSVIDTPIGKVGGLICWENYMPLARMALYQQGVEIYLAPTADAREQWQITIRHIALEGRCFVLASNQYVTKEMYPKDLATYDELENTPEIMSRGGSAIIDPNGQYLAGPLYDEEGVLYANLDLQEIIRSKFEFDVIGHYARPDVFNFEINTKKSQ